ncbi:MAG: hypothetical protein NC397_02545 [Clostridium sp.]|nr:hypothetical protein [Clostridium sp.]
MWISEHIVKESSSPIIQTGKSTLNANGNVEAVSTGVQRNLQIYSPYGYSASLPANVDILLADSGDAQVGIGVLQNSTSLNTGEIKITASSGAYIHLKSDGSVVINGLRINKNGVIE